MTALFHSFVYQPIYNLLVFLYDIVPGGDFGIAIILATILLKTALYPLSQKQIESQKKMQDIQPEMKEIQKKYKSDREKQSRAMMEFYRERKINPLSGCLPLIIQLVVLITIYRVLFNISNAGFIVSPNDLYAFISNPGEIHRFFLEILDLSKPIVPAEKLYFLIRNPEKIYQFFFLEVPAFLKPSHLFGLLLVSLTAGAQYYQMKMIMESKRTLPKKKTPAEKTPNSTDETPDFNQIMMKQMLYIGPGLTLFFGITFPPGLALYWLVSTLFMIGQQRYLLKKNTLPDRTSKHKPA